MFPKDFTIFQTRTFGWLRFGCPTTLSTTTFSSFSGSEVDLQNFMAVCAHVKSHKRCQQTYNRIDRIRGTLAEDVFRSSANRLLIIAKEGCFIMFLDWNIRFPCDLSRMTEEQIWLDLLGGAQRPINWHIFPHQTIYGSMDLEAERPILAMGSYLTVVSFFQPSHNSSSRHNQEIYCKYSAPKVTSNTPQCWLEFFCSILDTSVHFFLNFLPPNKMCPIKVSVPNPSFPRRPPSSTVPKLKSAIFWKLGPENSEISPSVLLNRSHCCWIFGKFPCRSIQCSGNIISIGSQLELEISSFYGVFLNDFCGFQVAKNVPRTMANAMWIFP